MSGRFMALKDVSNYFQWLISQISLLFDQKRTIYMDVQHHNDINARR